jgi:hypothetical protein
MAWRKGHGHQGHDRDNVAPGTQRGRTGEKRHLEKPGGSHGIRNRDFKEQLRLGNERTSGGIYRKALVLKIVKRTAGSSVRKQKMSDRTL